MAAPNIGSPNSGVFLRATSGSVGTGSGASATTVANNPSSSSTALRVTRLDIANIAGSGTSFVSVVRVASSGGVTTLANLVPVPAKSVLRIYDNAAAVAVVEGQSLRVFSSDSNTLTFDCEYQEFS